MAALSRFQGSTQLQLLLCFGGHSVVVSLQRFVHSSLSFPSSTLTTASLMPSCCITALAMSNECPPSRVLATLASAGPNTLVYDAGREGVLTVTCSVSDNYLTLLNFNKGQIDPRLLSLNTVMQRILGGLNALENTQN